MGMVSRPDRQFANHSHQLIFSALLRAIIFCLIFFVDILRVCITLLLLDLRK